MNNTDTGKAIISQFRDKDNTILVDIYANGKLLWQDVRNIHKAMESFDVTFPVDTICVKSGKNYFSDEAFEYTVKHHCIHKKVIYVIKHMADIHFPSRAQETFFKDHLVDYCTSIEEACLLLNQCQPRTVSCPAQASIFLI